MMAREDVVRMLMGEISGALAEACVVDPTITADEIFSAIVTEARNVFRVAAKQGANPARLRAAAEQLLLECADPRKAS